MPGLQKRCLAWAFAVLALAWAAQPSAAQEVCPGVAAGACGSACQQATCQALQTFYNATRVEQEWHTADGWQQLTQQSCQELIAGNASAAAPAYCTWRGISCCSRAGVAAGECSSANSISAVSLQVNALNGSIANASFLGAVGQLHACGLRDLVLDGNDLTGTLSPRWGAFTGLRTLDLGQNWLTGTLPDALAALTGLQRLELNTNYFHGTLPSWLSNLTQLQVLNLGGTWPYNGTNDGATRFTGDLPLALLRGPSLRELNVYGNAITGIPDPLCGPATGLQVLSMRSAGLTGSASGITSCSNLSFVDLSYNVLTGSLPATAAWGRLDLMQLQYNAFSGSIPQELYSIPLLAAIDISGNRITGTLSRSFMQLQYMSTFLASNNRLSGTIPADIFFAPSLTRLVLDSNQLSGTLPDSITYAASLEELVLADNPALEGPIPDGMATLAFLKTADVTGTSMNCSSSPSTKACAQPLPCFLQFAGYQVPMGSDQRCSAVLPKTPQQAARSCPQFANGLLAADAAAGGSELPGAGLMEAGMQGMGAQWKMDSSYYQQATCQCGADSIELWNPTRTALRCQPRPVPNMPWYAVLFIALFGTVFVLFAVGVFTRVLVNLRYQPGWLRQQEMRHKRVSGPPKAGTLSVVVTDIEGYHELSRASPALMARALGLHNAVLKKASWTNGGHVVDHEGPYFTIAFHEPADAVCFCLQAQQALMRVDWPHNLGVPSEGGSGNSGSEAQGSSRWRLLGMSISNGSFGKSFAARARRQNSGTGGDGRQRVSSEAAAAAAAAAATVAAEAQAQVQALADAQGGYDRSTPTTPPERHHSWGTWTNNGHINPWAAPDTQPSGTSSLLSFLPKRNTRSFEQQRTSSSLGERASMAGASTARSTTSGGSGRRFFPMLLRPVTAQTEGLLFYGLRVRMGIATGVLAEGQALQECPVVDLAKLVCDAGAGGQVLMEAHTFEAVKDRLNELGAVDARGLNDRLLQAKRMSRLGAALAWWRGTRRKNKHGSLTTGDEAVVMDMGEFEVPGISMEAANAAPAHGNAAHGLGLVSRLRSSLAGALMRDESEPPTAAETMVRTPSLDGQQQRGAARLRLYSVLPPSLVGRAKTWLNALALREGSTQTDRAYFDAPGTLYADLDPATAIAADAKALPPITMVFCCVEGAKQYVRRRRAEARVVHGHISTCIKAALAASPGGYLCREQDGELKYMVAFPNAHEALEWCLVMQDAMLYQPWPASVLAHPGFEEVFSEAGHLLFRGPRLKMGLCEGHPRTIMPDHLGRADYHGPSINQAARFMDAAAHGGQIACELELVERVFTHWRQEQEAVTQGDVGGNTKLPTIISRDLPASRGPTPTNAATNNAADTSLPEQPPTPIRALGAPARAPSAPAAISLPADNATNPWVPDTPHDGSRAALDLSPAAQQGQQPPLPQSQQQQQQAQQQQLPKHRHFWRRQQRTGPGRDSFEQDATSALPPVQRNASGASTSSSAPTPPTPDLVAVVGTSPSPFARDAAAAAAAAALGVAAAAPAPAAEAADTPFAVHRPVPASSSGGCVSPMYARRPTLQLPQLRETGELVPLHSDGPAGGRVSSPMSPINPEAQRRLALIFGQKVKAKRPAPSISRSNTKLVAMHLGTFRFKGSGDVEMAAVSLEHLSGRQFPAEPPKGKGARVAEKAGKADEATCALPTVARPFRKQWEAGMRAEAALRLLTKAEDAATGVSAANNLLRNSAGAAAAALASGSNAVLQGTAAGNVSGANALGDNTDTGDVPGSSAARGNTVTGSNVLPTIVSGSNALPQTMSGSNAARKGSSGAQKAAAALKRVKGRRHESVPEELE